MAASASGLRSRLATAGILVAVVAAVGLVVAVAKVGIHHPSPPSLEKEPRAEIPGTVAYVSKDGCVMLAEASGVSRREVRCGMDWVRFVDERTLEYGRYGPTITGYRRSVDGGPETPVATTRDFRGGPQIAVAPNGDRVEVEPGGDIYVASAAGRARIYDCDCPDGAWANVIAWTPDSAWVLLQFYSNRGDQEIWILRRDGGVVGTLVKGLRESPSWMIPGLGIVP
ncbi:MAG: TolB family protein [Dehalococcoidia bacterium]